MNKHNIILAGAIGYICLFYLASKRAIYNYGKNLPAHLVKNIALIVTGITLSIYYFKEAVYDLTDLNDCMQKKIKQIGYTSYVINILLKFHPSLKSKFESYDMFGIIGHSLIVYYTTYNKSSIIGYLFLLIYFIYKTYYYSHFTFLEVFTSLILFVNYLSLIILEYHKPKQLLEKAAPKQLLEKAAPKQLLEKAAPKQDLRNPVRKVGGSKGN